jgi:hypothetical protein
MKKIIIDLDALSGAARYLEEHNSNGKEREEIAKMMMDDIKRYAFDDRFGGTGTAGYYIFFDQVDNETVSVDILVQPTFGDNHCYMEVEV